jgi:hypothetical protein
MVALLLLRIIIITITHPLLPGATIAMIATTEEDTIDTIEVMTAMTDPMTDMEGIHPLPLPREVGTTITEIMMDMAMATQSLDTNLMVDAQNPNPTVTLLNQLASPRVKGPLMTLIIVTKITYLY